MTNPNLVAYYRLGDPPGNSVSDSSGNARTGSTIAGIGGSPAFGAAAAFLYDPNTSLDVTNGSNLANGGFNTIDNTTQPPTTHNPLSGAIAWTVECWIKNTSTTAQAAIGQLISFQGDTTSGEPTISDYLPLPSGLAVGDLIAGLGIPSRSYVTSISTSAGANTWTAYLNNNISSTQTPGTFTATPGGIGSTLFAAASTAASNEVDVRIGAFNATSGGSVGTVFNSVLVGPVIAGIYIPVGFSSNQQTLNGLWHQIAVSYAASVASIYIDGALDSAWPTGSNWSNPTGITVGCNAGALNGFTGLMQDVALYSTALTATQVANHYDIGTWFQTTEFGASVGGTNAGRFNKLMAVEGLPSAQMLNVPYQFRTDLYGETNVITTTSGLNYLQTMSETEPGLIFQGPNGMINAYNRQYQYLAPGASVSQGVFGDSNAASVQYHYDGPSFTLVQDDLDVWNNIQVQSGRSGAQLQQAGPAQFALAAQSASVYGSRTLQGLTSLQFAYDSDALAVAENYLQWYANPIKRVTTIMTDSYGNAGQNIPQILQRGPYDRLTVQYQGQTPGPQFSQDSLIESISHTVNIANGPIWTVQWAMSAYELVLPTMFLGVWKFGTAASVATLTL